MHFNLSYISKTLQSIKLLMCKYYISENQEKQNSCIEIEEHKQTKINTGRAVYVSQMLPKTFPVFLPSREDWARKQQARQS